MRGLAWVEESADERAVNAGRSTATLTIGWNSIQASVGGIPSGPLRRETEHQMGPP